jgi:hypothetical protein
VPEILGTAVVAESEATGASTFAVFAFPAIVSYEAFFSNFIVRVETFRHAWNES